jgi:peptide/nickel transport system ATP-binding protein
MNSAQTILSVNNLSISFEGENVFNALSSISFDIEKSECLALLGASGSGKSITSWAIMGLLPQNATLTGEIVLNGKSLYAHTTSWEKIRGKEVAMVFQEPMSALNPLMTCGNQIVEAIRTHQQITVEKAKEQALEWMQKVQLPDVEKLFNKYPHEISGGQKQRIVIAMALCNKPSLIIADEPTTALDVLVQLEIIQLLKKLQVEEGIALLFITHDMDVAKYVADKVCILEKGSIISRDIHTYAHKVVFNDDFYKLNHYEQAEVLLKVQDLKITYPLKKNLWGKTTHSFIAVNNVNLTIPSGTTFGLVGGSGCGKSTISKCILGIIKATSGQIWFRDTDLTQLSLKQWKKMRKHIQMIFQDPAASLSPKMKIKAMLEEILDVHQLYPHTEERKAYLSHLLKKVGLDDSALNKYPHEFSGGQKQRICIARALAVQPSFIVCDESIAALDGKMQVQILELLKSLQQSEQLTYLFITHDLKIAEQFCDTIAVMQQGQIVEIGKATTILQQPQHLYTQALKQAIL